MNMKTSQVVFLVNLLQDINILLPLACLVTEEFNVQIVFLASHKFIERDKQNIWQNELASIAEQLNASVHIYDSEYTAYSILQGYSGLVISASESNLSAHSETHNVFRIAPPSFLKMTLQHGFECVGFLQNREHNKAHGERVTFGADIVCGWLNQSKMKSLAALEYSKYCLTGPTALLPIAPKFRQQSIPTNLNLGGLVCENLHSVRINGESKESFMDTFFAFCGRLQQERKSVTLRPHPGGQYVLKNNIALPENADVNNLPMYKIDLTQYEYGISAPSSVVIDMLLANIPVAIWQDEEKTIDASHYEGLYVISDLEDWLAFLREVSIRKDNLLAKQRKFLQRSGMLIHPDVIYNRFFNILANYLGFVRPSKAKSTILKSAERILFIANSEILSLQIYFYKPLSLDLNEINPSMKLITSGDIKNRAKTKGMDSKQIDLWLTRKIDDFNPQVIIFCRYSDYYADNIVKKAKERKIPTVYFIDDDLFSVPKLLGEKKYKFHNDPERLKNISYLLNNVSLVCCSTEVLLQRFKEKGFKAHMTAGDIYCPGEVLKKAEYVPVRKIGYMGFDHEHDFEVVLPGLVKFLNLHKDVIFEIFGPIPKPAVLEQFGERIVTIAKIPNYKEFLVKFSSLGWDIGICPLADTYFNRGKTGLKWMEYTSIGAAVVATRGTVYDECCSDKCGILVDDDGWFDALNQLYENPSLRYEQVIRAQDRLSKDFSLLGLRKNIERCLAMAMQLVKN